MKKPTFLLGMIVVATSVLFAYTGIYAPYQKQGQLLQTQHAKEQTNQRTRADVAALLKTIESYRRRLPSERDPSWLIRETVAIAQKSGVEITNINQDPPKEFTGFTRLSVAVQFSASYHALGAFLDDIEHADRFIRVDHINVSRRYAGNNEEATIQLGLSTVYLPPVMVAP